jgi:hypothetical protein
MNLLRFAAVFALAPAACHDRDQGDDGGDTTADTSGAGSFDTSIGTAADSGGVGDCMLQESFDQDGSSWPSPWTAVGGVAVADVQGGRGRLVPTTSSYSLARMVAPLGCSDVEVTFSFEFTSANTQGVGFYVRQNGGHLQATTPRGQGYAVFAEAFRDPAGVGAWHELDGNEVMIEPIAPMALAPNTLYRVRYRVTQQDASTTSLQARVWPDGSAEPTTWQLERTDASPALQSRAGGVAIDAWSALTSGSASDLFVDDVVVTAAP